MLSSLKAILTGRKQTSPEMSALAGSILGRRYKAAVEPIPAAEFNALLKDAKRLAGSVLSQDENG